MAAVIVAFLVLVLGSLAAAGFYLLRRRPPGEHGVDKRMARALALRVALSVTLFLLILLAWALGWIHPHGSPLAPTS